MPSAGIRPISGFSLAIETREKLDVKIIKQNIREQAKQDDFPCDWLSGCVPVRIPQVTPRAFCGASCNLCVSSGRLGNRWARRIAS